VEEFADFGILAQGQHHFDIIAVIEGPHDLLLFLFLSSRRGVKFIILVVFIIVIKPTCLIQIINRQLLRLDELSHFLVEESRFEVLPRQLVFIEGEQRFLHVFDQFIRFRACLQHGLENLIACAVTGHFFNDRHASD